MAGRATYLGPRLKRLRRDLGLTQVNMAADLDISPSYVALIERNQRPVTADLLLKLAAAYRIDIADLAGGDAEQNAARLTAILKEPFFADIDLPPLDVEDIANSYPGMAEAFLRLRTAYGEEQLALATAREGGADPGSDGGIDPVAEAREFVALRRNCFPGLDDHAGGVAADVSSSDAMLARLRERHGLKIRFVDPEVLMGSLRWHNPHRRELMISNLLDHASRKFQLALQLGTLEAAGQVDEALGDGAFTSENARILARRALMGYWAAALLMPYRPFREAATKLRHDLEALGRLFGASFEQVAHRLTTLQKPGEEGVPFFFIRIDQAGNVSKRLDGAGFPFARHGGGCPLWEIHAAFAAPGRILPQLVELPDGQRFVSIARTVNAGGGGFNAPQATRAVALACAAEHRDRLVYAEVLRDEPTPIGVACRLCHRSRCMARSAPPIGRELRPDNFRDTGIPFAFAGD